MKYYDSMEFVSEEEAEEYLGHKAYGYYNESSFLQLNERDDYHSDFEVYDTETPVKKYVVMTFINGYNYYVAKKGYTYHLSEAKLMTEKDATIKAKSMTKNGSYYWRVVLI